MTTTADRLLVFDVHGDRYALGLHDVAEILEPAATFPIPRAPREFCGAINFHGSIVAVLDFALFRRLGAVIRDGKLIVLDCDVASLALRVGLDVDIVPTDIVLEEEEGDDPLVEKVLVMPDGEVRRIRVAALLDEAEATLQQGNLPLPIVSGEAASPACGDPRETLPQEVS